MVLSPVRQVSRKGRANGRLMRLSEPEFQADLPK
jgi:hypothetical protein